MNEINIELLIKNIIKVLIVFIIFTIIYLILTKGFNTLFIKVTNGVNKGKEILNDRLNKNNMNYKFNENNFIFLSKIKELLKNKYLLIFIISLSLIILWFIIFYILTQDYFNDSKIIGYKETDYNDKYDFGLRYSNKEKKEWVNSKENNYISKSGKLCRLNPSILNMCLGENNNLAEKNVFIDEISKPDFLNKRQRNRIKKNEIIYINYNNQYYPRKIIKVYNTLNQFRVDNPIKNDHINSVETYSFDNINKYYFKLKNNYFCNIEYSIIRDKLYNINKNVINKLFNKKIKNETFNNETNKIIKCKIINIKTNLDGYISELKLEIYNNNGSNNKIFNLPPNNESWKVNNELYLEPNGNIKNDSKCIREYFKTNKYIRDNLIIEYNNSKKRETSNTNNDDFSNILDLDIYNIPNPKNRNCIVYSSYNELQEGDIIKIENKNNNSNNKYFSRKYEKENNMFSEKKYSIDRRYILCDNSKKNKNYVNTLFNSKCLKEQEKNKNNLNDLNNYGCK